MNWNTKMDFAKLHRMVCKTLGEKCSDDDKEADFCCVCRLVWFVVLFISTVVTSGFIIAGVIAHYPK